MKRITLCTFLLIINFAGFIVTAQPINAAFRNLTPAEGLPITTVTDVTQDAFGFIWIGSWDGVYRYDGFNFKYIPSNGRYLTADHKGGVWISRGGGDLSYYDYYIDSLSRFDIPHANRFTDVAVDDSGTVWASTKQGIAKLDTELDSFLIDANQEKGGIYHLSSQDGQLLFICQLQNQKGKIGRRSQKGVYSYIDLPLEINYNPAELEFYTDPSSFNLTWYGSDGIFIMNRFGWAIKENGKDWNFKTADNKEALSENSGRIIDENGNLWLNQQNAITKINISSGSSTTYNYDPTDPNSILPMESVFAGSDIYIDRQGILWITRFSHGISRLNLYESDFGLVRDNEGNKIIDVLSALELDDGSLFIGSRIGIDGLLYFDPQGNIARRYGASGFGSPSGKTISNHLSHAFPWSLAQSSDGSIWVGTGSPGPNNGGLNRIRPGSDQITRFKFDPEDESSISGNWIFKILVDGSDRVWFNAGGICSIDAKTEKITRGLENPPFHPDSDSVNSKFYIPEIINSEGNLIIRNTIDQKHYVIDHKTQQASPFGMPVKNNERFFYVHQDDKGYIWFGDEEQFGYLDSTNQKAEKTFEYNTEKFPAREITALYSDHNRKIWLATDIGIFRFDPETQEYKHYTYNRGLQGNYFRNNVSYRGPSGKIYFGGNGGLNIIDPEKIKSNPYPPDMVFTELKIDGNVIRPGLDSPINKPLNVTNKLVVQPDNSVINIAFAAIHFAGFKDNKYQYMLEGFDRDWQDGGNVGSATYTSLPPGKYTFRIKGSNWDGIWSDGSKSIKIHILPPWWRTTFAYIIYSVLFIMLIYGTHKIQSRRVIAREREKTREKELAQAKEIEKAYNELEISHENLKATQSQLIQSEKMASLGELTAGIAHEIQNPLNFVNNFSEVSKELIGEMTEELATGNLQLATEIASDISQNLEKILHHGNRASGIVKGMLQHSRTSTWQKELTDINALADEYLRLAYHGLKAKDKSFNADFKTEFDESLPKINVIPQDIGRVLLNLINNAFYAIAPPPPKGGFKDPNYSHKPMVIVKTSYLPPSGGTRGAVMISVKDNGPGIPSSIVDKIFQPFFTTKPTGSGTGLGLSLSYDIVKAHGGEITVESKENEGTEFIISIPIQS